MKQVITFFKNWKRSVSFLTKSMAVVFTILFYSTSAFAQGEIQELPLMVDFEGFNGVNLSEINEGWYEATNNPPEGNSSGWYNSEVLYDDPHAAIELYSNTRREWIISPRFYATENTQVSFDAAITFAHDEPREGAFGGDDEFSIMVSTDGGNNFETLYTFSNSSSKTLEYDFKRFTFNLDEYSGSNIQIGFYASEGSQEDGALALHLDDIEIKDQKAKDANVFNIIQPSQNGCYSGEEKIVAQVKNEGYDELTNIPLKVKVRGEAMENFFAVADETIKPGDTADVEVGTLDMSEAGEYQFILQNQMEDDEFSYNNSFDMSIENSPVHSLPFEKISFSTSYSDIGEAYTGWKEYRGENYPMVEMDTDWQTDDFNGERAASLFFGNVGTIDWLVSPKFKPQEDTKLIFDFALEYEDGVTSMGSDDEMNIMLTTDCGETWEKLDVINKDTEISTENWNAYEVDLSDYENEMVQIAFYGYTGTNNDSEEYLFFLDNIEIRDVYNNDVGIQKLLSPSIPAEFSDNEDITVIIENYATSDVSDFEVSYKLNEEETVTETITSTIPAKESIEYTFSQSADLSGEDSHSIDVYTNLEDDGNEDNDGLYNLKLQAESFNPSEEGTFKAGFEEDENLNGWFVVNNNNDDAEWKLDDDPSQAYEGEYSYAYNSKGTSEQSDDWLFSPAIYFEEGEEYVVSFYFNNAAANFPEKLRLTLSETQNPDDVITNLVDLGEIDNNEYLKAEVNYTADSSGFFHLGFQNYGDPNLTGMHIDNVRLKKIFDKDIKVDDISVPRKKDPNTSELLDIDTINVEINNTGRSDVDDFTVNLTYNQGDTLTQDYSSQNIAAGDQVEVVFDNDLNLSKEEVYDFVVWTDYEEDLNTANDTFKLNDFYLQRYQSSFEPDDNLSEWKVVDVAGEGYTWEIHENDQMAHSGTQVYQLFTNSYDTDLTENEDWLFSEGFYLESDKCYKISFWYNAYYSEERLTFLMGQEQDITMNDTLTDFGIIGNGTEQKWQYKEIAVSVDQTGEYFFGWLANGSMDLSRYRLLIDDFELEQEFDFEPYVDFETVKLDMEYYFESEGENVEWYEWSFDDGYTSEEADTFHTYENTGDYEVRLVGGNACATDTSIHTINVGCDVTASFSYSADGKTVEFTNSSENAAGYFWDFGDDSTSTNAEPVHTFDEYEEYTVSLTSIGDCGNDTLEQTINLDSSATAIETDPDSQNMKVFPNPADDVINVQLLDNSRIASVQISNIAGNILLRKQQVKENTVAIDLEGIIEGVYILTITTENGDVITQKFQKQ